jgi:diaminopimelate decarboxylase
MSGTTMVGRQADPVVADLVAARSGDHPVCFYAYDLGRLQRHVAHVAGTLPGRCRMFYAMKANSAAPLLEVLAPLVAGFEVASGGEVAKARAAAPSAPVIFGGPVKTDTEIDAALEAQVARLHAESALELHRISRVARRRGAVADVLLRVNLVGPLPTATLSMAGRPTQFGIDERELPQAVAVARSLPGLRVVGFHLHSVSNVLSADDHLRMLELYRDRVVGWEHELGLQCEVVDVGGGIGVNYADLQAQFDWDRFVVGLARLEPTFPAHWRHVDFECGRYLVAACGRYVAEVMDVKLNHDVPYALLRGGTHHFRLPASWQHSHPFTVVPVDAWPAGLPRPELRDVGVTLVGELCTPKDVLARDVVVDRLRVGDVVVFEYAGAYGWEISHHDFLSHPHPERVFIDVEAGGGCDQVSATHHVRGATRTPEDPPMRLDSHT